MNKLILKFRNNIIKEYDCYGTPISIGRYKDNDIVIDNMSVSKHHAKVEVVDGKYILTDLGSTNGTFLNKKQVKEIELKSNDNIIIGKHSIAFKMSNPKSSEQQTGNGMETMILETKQQKELLANQVIKAVSEKKKRFSKLIISQAGSTTREFQITKDLITIGKLSDSDIVIKGFFVPDNVAKIFKGGDGYYIKGYGGWVSVRINGHVGVKNEIKLFNNDIIEIRKTKMIFYS